LKTLKISDEAHAKLTSVIGRLMAETGKMKTYSDAIEATLKRSVMFSPKLLDQVGSFIEENPQLGYTTREEFIQDAIRSRLTCLTADEHIPEPPGIRANAYSAKALKNNSSITQWERK
jgi:metal-responsive CopG/Arc/MetJ family transcriptional regulator